MQNQSILTRAVACGLLLVSAMPGWAKGPGHGKGKSHDSAGKGQAGERCFKPEVLQKIFKDNPTLKPNFLTHSAADTPIRLGDGNVYPLYRLDQFLQANFRIQWFARQKEGEEMVRMMEKRLRKLMALPDFHERVVKHAPEYRISPEGRVSPQDAYNHFRSCSRRIGVTAGKQYKCPVGGGGGIAAPSWAVWRAMNLFEHETCHCIGIGHNSGGLSGPIAGTLRRWDRQEKWNYPTIDANTLAVTPAEPNPKPSITPRASKKHPKHPKAGTKPTPDPNPEDDENIDSLDAGPEDDVVKESNP